jgi:hypothetical protein
MARKELAQRKSPTGARTGPDRFTRVVILVWAVAGVILLSALFRALKAAGAFAFVGNTAPAACHDIALSGPGDLAWDAKTRTLFIAAAREGAPGKEDGLYALTPGAPRPVKLAGTPADFHPAAVSVGYDASGVPVLATVNRHANGTVAVEIYGVDVSPAGLKLSYQSAIQGGLARRAAGIAALGNSRFYLAANPTRSDLMAAADRILQLGRADLLFFNGMLFREAVKGLSDPSGVAVSADGARVYVAARGERRLIGFSREPFSGGLTELGSVSLPMRPERVSVDAGGTVWVAGPARLPSLSDQSVVARVSVGPDGKPQSADTVYAGEGIRAATAAVKTDGHLFIGSSRDNKLLDCAVK